MNSKILGIFLVLMSLISGCQTTPSTPPKATITFMDTTNFDREMSDSLSSKEKDVKVSFYNPVSPNEMPRRLEKWVAEVNNTGGKVTIVQPVGEPAPKNPLLLIGIFGSLWDFSNKATEISAMANLKTSVQNRNAVIQLMRNKQGDMYVEKISFPTREE
jgi:hypothetical protein